MRRCRFCGLVSPTDIVQCPSCRGSLADPIDPSDVLLREVEMLALIDRGDEEAAAELCRRAMGASREVAVETVRVLKDNRSLGVNQPDEREVAERERLVRICDVEALYQFLGRG